MYLSYKFQVRLKIYVKFQKWFPREFITVQTAARKGLFSHSEQKWKMKTLGMSKVWPKSTMPREIRMLIVRTCGTCHPDVNHVTARPRAPVSVRVSHPVLTGSFAANAVVLLGLYSASALVIFHILTPVPLRAPPLP